LGFDFASFDGFSAAITTIVRATTVVVFVVAVAISFVLWELAAPVTFFAFGIFALAFGAVFGFEYAAFDGFSTAIATIIRTSTVVVIVVAVAIPFVIWKLASSRTSRIRLAIRVFALACFAVFCFNGASFHGFSTAISTIVLTTTVVVVVIAIAISFVVRELAAPFAVGVALIVRIQTFALLAIFSLYNAIVRLSTAITSIPIAFTIVVFVVTVSVFLVIW